MSTESVRLLNATSTGEALTFEAPSIDFARFDRLPASLRWRIACNNTKLAARAFEAHIGWSLRQGFGPERTIAKINEHERHEIAVAAGEYRGKFKLEYPHTAAVVSIQRYGELGPSRHPPLRYGKPVVWPKKRGRRRL